MSSEQDLPVTPGIAPPPPLEATYPINDFFTQGPVAAGVLVLSAAAALVFANSPWSHIYEDFLHAIISFEAGPFGITQSVHHWINDGLMSIFFFLVGLEIKRELLNGELASFQRALLPAVAAMGGMAAPSLIYLAFNFGEPSARGWGITMATDIAFATGALALLGGRAPRPLGIFLLALAIVDDIGSVLVIALFYSESIAVQPLAWGAGILAVSVAMNKMGMLRTGPYVVLAILLWLCFLQSGVHATLAGVLFAFTIPSSARYQAHYFQKRMLTLVERFMKADDDLYDLRIVEEQQTLIRKMLQECHHVEPPLQRIEHSLHPLSVLFIMPMFAFANAGVELPLDSIGPALTHPVTLGIVFGLVAGKPVGIFIFSWAAVRFGWASIPKGVTWPQLFGVACLGGIGFTVSLFINGLAFAGNDEMLAAGKLGIFLASFVASLAGLLSLWFFTRGTSAVETSANRQ